MKHNNTLDERNIKKLKPHHYFLQPGYKWKQHLSVKTPEVIKPG